MTGCSCVYVGEYDSPKFLNTIDRVARKVHTCSECGRAIDPGEVYEYSAGKWDSFSTYKTCRDCVSVRDEMFCEGWVYGCLWEDVAEHIRNVGDDVLSCDVKYMTRAGRDRLLDLVEEQWEDE